MKSVKQRRRKYKITTPSLEGVVFASTKGEARSWFVLSLMMEGKWENFISVEEVKQT